MRAVSASTHRKAGLASPKHGCLTLGAWAVREGGVTLARILGHPGVLLALCKLCVVERVLA